MFQLAVLISGNGSNLQAIIDAIEQGLPAKLVVVISNRQDAYGLQRAKQHHIPTVILKQQDYPDRQAYDQQLLTTLESFQPDLIALAGFMRILTPQFVQHFYGKLINIHPSLLPKYTGLHTHQRVLAAKEAEHGSTVHFVSQDLDAGPIIAYSKLRILANDTEGSLQQRVLSLEHKLYPQVIQWFAENRLKLINHEVILDQHVLPANGHCLSVD